MSGGIAQILAQGPQDVNLTGTPEVSFFQSMYKQYTPFAQSVERQTITNNPAPGGMSSILLERKGDLLSYMYLTARDSSNKVINIDWSAAIDKCELWIGGVMIDMQDSMYHKLVEPVALANSYSKRYKGTTTGSGYFNAVSNTFYPIKFFFAGDYNLVLPLVSVTYQDIEIRIYWKTSMSQSYFYEAWTNFVYLGNDERQYFAQCDTYDMLVTQVQRQIVPSDYTAQLVFNQPVKFLAANVNSYSNGDQQLKLTINGTDIGVMKPLPHYQEVKLYYNTPYGWAGNNTSHIPPTMFLYPFCLDTAKHQPTGTLNFSRIDTFYLSSPSGTTAPLAGTQGVNPIFTSDEYIYAVSYNILRIQKGMAALVYAN